MRFSASSPISVISAEEFAAIGLPLRSSIAAMPGRAQQPSWPGESSMFAKIEKALLPRAISLITATRPRLLKAASPAAIARMRSAEFTITWTWTSRPCSLKKPFSMATRIGTCPIQVTEPAKFRRGICWPIADGD